MTVATSRKPPAARRLIRICVASCNTRAPTELCIRSMRHYADRPFELTVGDAGSTDGSLELLRELETRAWLRLEIAPEGRMHADWLTHWYREAEGELLLFVDSDVEFRRRGWLGELVDTAVRERAAIVAGDVEPERGFQVEPVGGKTVRLARRAAPWLLLVDTERTAGLDETFAFRAEHTDAVPEGLIAYDVGAWFLHRAIERGCRWVAMPPSFAPAFHHYGGLSWIKTRGRRQLKKRLDLWTVSRHLRRLRRLQERA